MDALLESREQEFTQLRADFDDLYDKFKQTSDLFADRESIYQKQISELEGALDALQRKNENLKFTLKTQTAAKEAFVQDVLQLQEVGKMMEQREASLLIAYQDLETRFMEQKRNLENISTQKDNIEAGNSRLSQTIAEQMVHKSEHSAVLAQVRSLESTLQQDYVPKVLNSQLQEDLRALREHLEQNTVERGLYETMTQKYTALERRLDQDFVPREEYRRLQQLLDSAVADHQMVEEAQRVLQRSDAQLQAQLEEAEARIVSLKGRVEQSEQEMASMRVRMDEQHEENLQQKVVIAGQDDDLNSARQRLYTSEQQVHSLHTQLGQLKLSYRQECEAKQEAVETKRKGKQSHEEQIATLQREHAQSILDNNLRLQAVFDITESQLRQQLAAAEEKVMLAKQSLDQLPVVQQQLQTEKKTNLEMRTALAVATQEAQHFLTLSLELKAEKAGLQEENARLSSDLRLAQQQMEELRVLVLSELSPSFRRLLASPSLQPQSEEEEHERDQEPSAVATLLEEEVPEDLLHTPRSGSNSVQPQHQLNQNAENALEELAAVYRSAPSTPAALPSSTTAHTRSRSRERKQTPPPRHLLATSSSAARIMAQSPAQLSAINSHGSINSSTSSIPKSPRSVNGNATTASTAMPHSKTMRNGSQPASPPSTPSLSRGHAGSSVSSSGSAEPTKQKTYALLRVSPTHFHNIGNPASPPSVQQNQHPTPGATTSVLLVPAVPPPPPLSDVDLEGVSFERPATPRRSRPPTPSPRN